MPKIEKNKKSSAYKVEKVFFNPRFLFFYFHMSWKNRIFAAVLKSEISYSKIYKANKIMEISALQKERAAYQPKLPKALQGAVKIVEGAPTKSVDNQEEIKKLFPNTYGMPLI